MLELLAPLELKDPGFLTLLPLAIVVFWLATRERGSINFPTLRALTHAPSSLKIRLRQLPAWLITASLVCLIVALSGPRTGDERTRVKAEGIAIMLVVDRSGSMDARDFVSGDYSVNRLDAVKQVLSDFVLGGEQTAGRPDDLVGLVAFGTYADSMSPLTLDHANLISIVADLDVATEQGESATAIGEGLGLAVERLRVHAATSKVVVLLTDGVNNAGALEPLQAAELARKYGITVYTVGAGSTGMAPIPVRMSNGQTVLRPQPMQMDSRTLKRIATATDGRYFHARDADGLAEVYREIDALERSEINDVKYLQYREHYIWWVLAALGLLALAQLLHSTWLARLP